MAIILRQNTATNTGKGTKLTFAEMDSNLESFYISSSFANNTLILYTTGSVSHSVDLSSFGGNVDSGSFMASASAAGGVITFEKIDGSTFDVTITNVASASKVNIINTSSSQDYYLVFAEATSGHQDLRADVRRGGVEGDSA